MSDYFSGTVLRPASKLPPMALDVRGWYNEAEFSDLTIKLSNGTEVKVHKLVICKANDYFRKMCGPTSQFAVSIENLCSQ